MLQPPSSASDKVSQQLARSQTKWGLGFYQAGPGAEPPALPAYRSGEEIRMVEPLATRTSSVPRRAAALPEVANVQA